MAVAIFTVVMKPYDPENPSADRVAKILAGNNEVRCTKISMDFKASELDTLVLRIPLRYVNIIFNEKEEM